MSWSELVIVLVAIVIGAVIKAVTGMGLPLIAIPIAALFVDLDDAVVVIAFPNLLANGALAWRERREIHRTQDLGVLAATGIAGAVVGTIAFVNLPEEPLVLLLVASIVFYVVNFLAHPDLRVGPERSRRWSPAVGLVAGGFQGAIGISGPIVGAWVHSFRLPRPAHVLQVTSIFLISGSTQFVVLLASGELSGRVGASALACIPVLASIPVGTWLRGRLSVRGFDRAIIALLVVSAASLLLKTFV